MPFVAFTTPRPPRHHGDHHRDRGAISTSDETSPRTLPLRAGTVPAMSSTRDAWTRLQRRARATGGVVTAQMAEDCGIPRSSFWTRVRAERWVEIYPGAVLLPGATVTPEVAALAAILILGDRAVVSHQSALALEGLVDPPPVAHVSVPYDRHATSSPHVKVHRSRTLVRGDVAMRRGVRRTTVGRSLRDVACDLDLVGLLDLITEAERRRLVTIATLEEQARRQSTGRGAALFAEAVQIRIDDRTESALERDTVRLCRANGFVPHPGPYPLRVASGRTLHLDIAFVDLKIVIECDGLAYHSSNRAFEIDRRRWGQIQDMGWRVIWVTRRRLLEDPDGIIAELRSAVAARS